MKTLDTIRAGLSGLILMVGSVSAGPAAAAQDLLDIYGLALEHNIDLRSARAEAGAADARYRQARGQLLPQLSASAGVSRVRQTQTIESEGAGNTNNAGTPTGTPFFESDDDPTYSDQRSYTLDLRQPIFNWQAWQEQRAADARVEAAVFSLSAAEQSLIVQVADAYFDVLAARDALASSRQRRRSIQRQLDRAAAAFDAGLEPVTDRQEAQSSLDSARVDAIDAENRLAAAREQLILLTGRAPESLAGIESQAPVTAPDAERPDRRDGWLALARVNAPAIARAHAAWQAARAQVSAERGGLYPTVDLVARAGRDERPFVFGGGGGTRPDLIDETQSIGLQLNLPLFAGGSTRAAVDEATYEAEQARLDWIAARRQLRIDIADALRNVRAAARRVAALDAAINSGQTAVAAARAGYRLGDRTIGDVIDAEATLTARRADRKRAWYDHALARLRLARIAGVLDFEALAWLNRQLQPEDAAASLDASALDAGGDHLSQAAQQRSAAMMRLTGPSESGRP